MMIPVIAHPGHRIARKRDGRAGGKKEFDPRRHFESAMRQIAMQIKRGADPRPKINRDHDRQIDPFEPRAERDKPEHLEPDQDDEQKEIELIVLKHGRWSWPRGPGRKPTFYLSF